MEAKMNLSALLIQVNLLHYMSGLITPVLKHVLLHFGELFLKLAFTPPVFLSFYLIPSFGSVLYNCFSI